MYACVCVETTGLLIFFPVEKLTDRLVPGVQVRIVLYIAHPALAGAVAGGEELCGVLGIRRDLKATT